MTTEFISGDDNTKAIKEIFKTKEMLKCAVAFWGEKAWELLKDSKQEIRIICNLESGATNPFLIERLRGEKKNIRIRTQHNLHAKVYFTGNQAIVGSSNTSANGLSLEDEEAAGYIEASVITSDKKIIDSINSWFEELWENAYEIDKNLLQEAIEKWKNRRNNRPHRKNTQIKSHSLLDALRENPENFKGRRVFFAFYHKRISKEANEAYLQAEEEYSETEITAYENWDRLPEDAYLINIYYDLKNRFEFEGIYKTDSPHTTKIFKYINGGEGSIILAFKKDAIKIDSTIYEITSADQTLLKIKISELWKGTGSGKVLSLYTAGKVLSKE